MEDLKNATEILDYDDCTILKKRFSLENIGYKSIDYDDDELELELKQYNQRLDLFDDPKDLSYNHLKNLKVNEEKVIQDLIDKLSLAPFKLKAGFIDFWVITFLYAFKEDYALYLNGVYIPSFTLEIAQLLNKKPKTIEIKKIDVTGIKLDSDENTQLLNRKLDDKIRTIKMKLQKNEDVTVVFIQN